MVQQPVEHRDGGGVFGQEPAPVFERPVAADAEGAAFIAGGDESEQQLGAGVVERREAELVQLCRCRHSWTYAEPGTMPTSARPPGGRPDSGGLLDLAADDWGGIVPG